MVESMKITEQKQHGNRKIYTHGFPNYQGLSDEQKYRLLYPLAETIHNYFQDPDNREKFEKWKAEYIKQNPAKPQDFSLTISSLSFIIILLLFCGELSKPRILF